MGASLLLHEITPIPVVPSIFRDGGVGRGLYLLLLPDCLSILVSCYCWVDHDRKKRHRSTLVLVRMFNPRVR